MQMDQNAKGNTLHLIVHVGFRGMTMNCRERSHLLSLCVCSLPLCITKLQLFLRYFFCEHAASHLTKAKPALDHMSPPPLKLNSDMVLTDLCVRASGHVHSSTERGTHPFRERERKRERCVVLSSRQNSKLLSSAFAEQSPTILGLDDLHFLAFLSSAVSRSTS